MAITVKKILALNTYYNFSLNTITNLNISLNNQIPSIDFILGQSYIVSWGTSSNDLISSECVAQSFNNKIYLGNFLLNNTSSDSSFTTLPYLLEFSTGIVNIYTTNQSSNSFVFGIDLYEDNSTNIVLKDPLGKPVTYGEYDIVSLLTSSGKTV